MVKRRQRPTKTRRAQSAKRPAKRTATKRVAKAKHAPRGPAKPPMPTLRRARPRHLAQRLPRPASQAHAKATRNPYDAGLERNPANYQPLTPLSLLERAASVFPSRPAVVHGALRRNYADFYARARRLASALSQRGIGRGECGRKGDERERRGAANCTEHQCLPGSLHPAATMTAGKAKPWRRGSRAPFQRMSRTKAV